MATYPSCAQSTLAPASGPCNLVIPSGVSDPAKSSGGLYNCAVLKQPLKSFGTEKQQPEWHDWKWQFRNRITNVDHLSHYLCLTEDEKAAFSAGGTNLPFAITPYYLDVMQQQCATSALRKTVVPRMDELTTTASEMVDPCGEDGDMVAPGLVHRYPDRVLFLVNETCSVYCRYCTRSRVVGSGEHEVGFEAAYQYLENTPQVRDVLISGGDPLVMANHKLDAILTRLRQIPHIDIVRIGSKIPVVLPQRITDDLVAMLKKHHPFYMSIHFLHPDEITPEVEAACNKLADAGIPTFSQTVLLKGVNDDPEVMKALMLKLLKIRVRPYYIYQCDPVQGTSHFRTPVQTGLDIMQHLRGHMTGYGVPTYVIDAPGGGGKVPLHPETVLSHEDGVWRIRNFEGRIFEYAEIN